MEKKQGINKEEKKKQEQQKKQKKTSEQKVKKKGARWSNAKGNTMVGETKFLVYRKVFHFCLKKRSENGKVYIFI